MAHDHHHHHHHSHGHHDHGHPSTATEKHSHAPKSFGPAFVIGIALNSAFVVAEVICGLSANSLALLADAAHNLGDVLGLLLSGGAIWLSKRLPTVERTYGYGRGTILAALANAVVLFVSVGGIGIEAIQRLLAPQAVVESTVIWVATLGILINGATALLFMSGRTHDVNIRAAFLHMAADAGISLGVVVSAIVIGVTGWLWVDPVASFAIAIAIAVGTWGLLTAATNLALDAVPDGMDAKTIKEHLRALPGVTEVHDLHVWGISTTEAALTAHLVRPNHGPDDGFLARATTSLKDRFGIGHATLQIEAGDPHHPCALAPDQVV